MDHVASTWGESCLPGIADLVFRGSIHRRHSTVSGVEQIGTHYICGWHKQESSLEVNAANTYAYIAHVRGVLQ